MSRRQDQRRQAVFALYQHDVTGRELDDLIERDASMFTRALAYAAEDYAEQLDPYIERHAKGWTLDRIAPLERSILRVALHEMQSRPDVPDEVAIDEAIEAAKELCSAEAPKFVNGILGAAQRERVGTG
jgi:N utilization substance protein B